VRELGGRGNPRLASETVRRLLEQGSSGG
jgi:hypothetical protein